MYPFIRIGTLTFESYTMLTNLGTVCGLFAAYLVLEKYCRKEKYYWKMVPFLFLMMLVGDPWSRFLKGLFGGEAGNDGTHFLARVFLACIVLPFFMHLAWKDKASKEQALNSAALYFVVQHFFNRVACWMNGCCGGIYLEAVNGRVGTQLFEAGMMALIAVFLYVSIRKKKPFFKAACTGYAVVIFVSEYFIDQPELGRILTMTSIQLAAIVMILWVQFPVLKSVGIRFKMNKKFQ